MDTAEQKIFTSNIHHRIPVLPIRPRVRPIDGKIHRSYPVGRQSFSRVCQGQIFFLTITIDMQSLYQGEVLVNLITTLNSQDGETWNTIPFTAVDSRTWVCKVKANQLGLHSFRAEFSMDEVNTWVRDNVTDAWVLVDPPQVDGLRLYTMIPNVSGSLTDWASELKRISDMGFNAVHLLPLTTLDTSESPYSANDLFSVDTSYLDPLSNKSGLAQLEEFVEAAKTHNIRLCFDLVLNHVGVHSVIAKKAPDWIVPDPDQYDGFQRARYWTGQEWCYWSDLILINYEHPSESIRAEIWNYMTQYMLFWAKYANDTGGFVRFDNLHSSNPQFVQSLTETLNSTYPEVAILAEYFTDENTLLHTSSQWGLNLILATPWDYKFVPKLREYLNYIHRVAKHVRYYMPVTSHDSGSPAQEFCSVDSTIPRYVAAALMGTGATGIIQGVEYGIEEKINFIGRKPKMQFPAEAKFADFISKVNSILVEYPAFRQGENCRFIDNAHHAIIAAFRQDPGTENLGFLVVCNFDIAASQKIAIDLGPILGTVTPVKCVELLTGESLSFTSTTIDLELPSSSAMVLKF